MLINRRISRLYRYAFCTVFQCYFASTGVGSGTGVTPNTWSNFHIVNHSYCAPINCVCLWFQQTIGFTLCVQRIVPVKTLKSGLTQRIKVGWYSKKSQNVNLVKLYGKWYVSYFSLCVCVPFTNKFVKKSKPNRSSSGQIRSLDPQSVRRYPGWRYCSCFVVMDMTCC